MMVYNTERMKDAHFNVKDKQKHTDNVNDMYRRTYTLLFA